MLLHNVMLFTRNTLVISNTLSYSCPPFSTPQINMESVLKKLGLEKHLPSFISEKISPDIVCKMSLHEMHSVGIVNRSDVMRLRTACVSYGSAKPHRVKCAQAGPPQYEIKKDHIETLLDIGFSIGDISKVLSISESTVYRRMRNYDLKKFNFTNAEDAQLTEIVHESIEEFPNSGERMLKEILYQKGTRLTRNRLRDIIHEYDGQGVVRRRLGRLHRRVYHTQAPNEIWHVDTNHKLIRWGLIVAAGIDGFSRLVTFVRCVDNNKADTLLLAFQEGVENYGVPRRVRTDKGMENVKIADYMIERVGADAIITGKSVHNQRIERLWRDVYDGVLSLYYSLFSFLEDENILNISNPIHVYALHYVYLHKIDEKLKLWRDAWGSHRLRTVGSSPACLWTAGMMNKEYHSAPNTDSNNSVLSQINDTQRPVYETEQPVISRNSIARLHVECPKNWKCTNHGISIFVKALDILTHHIQQ